MPETKAYLQESKALLARLMAQENISVVYEKTPVPWFNLKDRTVHLPIWKELSEDLLTMLVWHEIGHALETPPQGWHSAVLKCTKPHCDHKVYSPRHGQEVDNPKCYHGVFKDYMNVCEDARMEKLQKARFPGIKRVFAGAYRDLNERDYFGIKDRNVNKMSLIDRINIHTKMGSFVPVTFNKAEQKLVDQLAAAVTWDEMMLVCRKIYEYAKAHKNEQPEQTQTVRMKMPSPQQEGDEGEDGDDQNQQGAGSGSDEEDDQKSDEGKGQGGDDDDQSEDSDDSSSTEGDEGEETGSGDDSGTSDNGDDEGSDESDKGSPNGDDSEEDGDEDDSSASGSEKGEDDAGSDGRGESSESDGDEQDKKVDSKSPTGDKGGSGGDEEAPISETDRAQRENDKKLLEQIDESKTPNIIPVNLVMQDYDVRTTNRFVKLTETLEKFERAFVIANGPVGDYRKNSTDLLNSMLRRNRPQINQLISEFNRRKNASQYLRQREARSGEIDMRKLAQYKIRSDIFRTFTTTTQGKSHGLVMFLDMSSSMDGLLMYAAVEQILVLSYFCQALGLPYEVYGFSDSRNNKAITRSYYNREQKDPRAFDMENVDSRNWHIIHLVSSRSGNDNLDRARRMLSVYAEMHTHMHDNTHRSAKEFSNKDVPYINKLKADYSIWRSITENFGLDTAGTPLVQALISSRALIESLKEETRVDIVNVIHLTDGQGNGDFMPEKASTEINQERWGPQRFRHGTRYDISITDERTKTMEYIRGSMDMSLSCEEAIIRLLKRTTGARHIGFYIGRADAMAAYLTSATDHITRQSVSSGSLNRAKLIEQLKNDGCVNLAGLCGFDSYYLIDLDPNMFAKRISDGIYGESSHKGDGTLNKRALEKLEQNYKDTQRKQRAERFLTQQFANDLATQEGMEISANTAFQRV